MEKLMPNFVDQLKVPLIVISDAQSQTFEKVYVRDESEGVHFNQMWNFSEVGFTLANKDFSFQTMQSHINL